MPQEDFEGKLQDPLVKGLTCSRTAAYTSAMESGDTYPAFLESDGEIFRVSEDSEGFLAGEIWDKASSTFRKISSAAVVDILADGLPVADPSSTA